jgi:hypothetical protein
MFAKQKLASANRRSPASKMTDKFVTMPHTAVVQASDLNRVRREKEWLRWLVAGEWVVVAALTAIFFARGLIPAWRTLNTDFPNYYVAAALHRRGIPLDRAYEWIWFQRQKDHLGVDVPLVGFMPNPPMCAAPILPLTLLSPLAAKRAWLILNCGLLILALKMLHRVTSLPYRRILLVSFLCVVPLRTNFLYGQYYIVVLFLICAAYYTWQRGHRFAAGMLLALAASFKLFPALFLILFLWKRDWRTAVGLVSGGAALAATSVAMFGWQVHKVFLIEVLPRALHGDIIDPYSLRWNSFSTLWHRLFLLEPELNPSPWFNSPLAYALAQAVTAIALFLVFFLVVDRVEEKRTVALEWAAFVPLLLLQSSMPASYHYCVMIFAGVLAVDALCKLSGWRNVAAFLLLFALAFSPVPDAGRWLTRLFATLALYVLLLCVLAPFRQGRLGREWFVTAALLGILLFGSNVRTLENRAQDFNRRLRGAAVGYMSTHPVVVGNRIVFTKMLDGGYGAFISGNQDAQLIPLAPDVLGVAGSGLHGDGYFEQTTRQSSIVRLAPGSVNSIPETIAEGEQPTVSSNGKWLAFVRGEGRTDEVWLANAQGEHPKRKVTVGSGGILDVSVSVDGDLFVAMGPVSSPHLALVRQLSNVVEPLPAIPGPARYPALSPDGKWLAFSRRNSGSWQLVVHDLATGFDRQLTHASCNAILPAWQDSHTVLYATDCGRGLGLSALALINLEN